MCLSIYSSLMASFINIGKIVRSEKKLKAMVNVNLIAIFVQVPSDFFFYESLVNPVR